MRAESREIPVAPDRFEVVTEDVILSAELRSAIAVCIYDAVDESGALLHLRFITRGTQPMDVTDTTLATELLLLDRCVEALREAAPSAKALQAKIAVHLPRDTNAMEACDKMLTLVGHFLRDSGAEVTQPDVGIGDPRRLSFRPSMGWLLIK